MNYSIIHNFRSSKLAVLIQGVITLSDDRYWLLTEGNTFVVEVKCMRVCVCVCVCVCACGSSSKLLTAYFET